MALFLLCPNLGWIQGQFNFTELSLRYPYSHKMHGIIGKTLNMEQYIIDIDSLDSNILKITIDTIWSNRVAIKRHLKNVVPEVKEKSLLNGYYLAEYLGPYLPATEFPV